MLSCSFILARLSKKRFWTHSTRTPSILTRFSKILFATNSRTSCCIVMMRRCSATLTSWHRSLWSISSSSCSSKRSILYSLRSNGLKLSCKLICCLVDRVVSCIIVDLGTSHLQLSIQIHCCLLLTVSCRLRMHMNCAARLLVMRWISMEVCSLAANRLVPIHTILVIKMVNLVWVGVSR